ncbi:hypothetical protein [Azospirillum sp. B4]|uniref:hypothetical protein n=1 Tax=Azospirillum sp. B4 TaxID=95605 RepID=UPI0005C9FC2C|nr:hypothetical protein [Azospirillum sp. B4]
MLSYTTFFVGIFILFWATLRVDDSLRHRFAGPDALFCTASPTVEPWHFLADFLFALLSAGLLGEAVGSFFKRQGSLFRYRSFWIVLTVQILTLGVGLFLTGSRTCMTNQGIRHQSSFLSSERTYAFSDVRMIHAYCSRGGRGGNGEWEAGISLEMVDGMILPIREGEGTGEIPVGSRLFALRFVPVDRSLVKLECPAWKVRAYLP